MLQNDVYNAMLWFSNNGMAVNAQKTQLVCFRSPLKTTVINLPLYLHKSNCVPCKCTPIPYVDCVKYLGIFFDSNLSWQHHLSLICSKLRSVAWLMFNMKSIAPLSVKKLIVHALGYSVLRYGITVFGFCSDRWRCRVDRIIKNILINVAYNSQTVTAANIFRELGLPNFHSLLVETVVIKHFWTSAFKQKNTSTRELRKHVRYMVPRSSTKYGAARRCAYVPDMFNKLPNEIFNATSKSMLKELLKESW